jgi:hypothetical protein
MISLTKVLQGMHAYGSLLARHGGAVGETNVFKDHWAIESVGPYGPRFARPTRVSKLGENGKAWDDWEFVAFGLRLYVAINRR